MPSKYSEQQKNEALEMLRIGDHIGFVHYTTGIPERTLRHWRQKLREQADCQTAEKSFAPAIAARQDTNADAFFPRQQHEPADTNSTDHQEVQADADRDYEDFNYIREKLMSCARVMARDLQPNQPDINTRSLALSRILDRIEWLDELLPDQEEEQVIRFAYTSDGVETEAPHWAMDEPNPRDAYLTAIFGDDYNEPR